MRPLLVLLLVLGAVGALVFAVMTLGDPAENGSSGAGPIAPGPAAVEPGPAGPRDLPDAPDSRRDQVASAPRAADAQRGRVAEQGTGYANEVTGSVQDPQGAPVAEATVTLTRHGSQSFVFVNDAPDRSGDRTAKTDAEGVYRFTNVEPYDHYALIVEHPDYPRTEEAASPVPPSGTVQEPPIVLHGGARLSGFVRGSKAGESVPGAELVLYGTFFGMGDQESPDQISTTADANGFYEFTNVAPGHRTLSVSADGYGNAMVTGIQLQRGDDVTREVTLELAEMIAGTVVGPGNRPLEGARVLAMSYASGPRQCRDETTTGPDGRFRLEHVTPGQYTVAVTAVGYKPDREARVEAGQMDLLFELAPKASISGQVVAADTGQPLTAFEVQLRVAHENVDATGAMGPKVPVRHENGEFRLEDVSEGSFAVLATAPGYAPSLSDRFRVTGGQDVAGVLIRLTRGGAITGRIVGPDGSPIAGALVESRDSTWTDDVFTNQVLGDQFPTNATTRKTRTNDAGVFTLENLTPAAYQVRIKTDRYTELVRTPIQVSEGATNELGDLALEEGGEIRGSVRGADGQLVPGAMIQLRPDGARPGQVARNYNDKANASGEFHLRNVAPGSYRLSAYAPGAGGGDVFGQFGDQTRSERSIVVSSGREERVELKLGG